MTVTIFHNPDCGTSRNVLALIRHAGIDPEVIEYLKTPPTKERLRALITAMGIPVRDLLREKGTPYADLGLGDPAWTDDELLDFIGRYPILMNRPIVVTSLGTALCRPSEAVLRVLPCRSCPGLRQGRRRSGLRRWRPACMTGRFRPSTPAGSRSPTRRVLRGPALPARRDASFSRARSAAVLQPVPRAGGGATLEAMGGEQPPSHS